MQTLTERPATQPGTAGTLGEEKIRRFDSRIIPPEKVQLGQELDDGKGPSRVTLSVTGLTVKVTAGFSWLYRLLAGPPMSQRDRFRHSATVAHLKHKAMATCWAYQPTRGFL
ncbi:MAG: hypothetical protein IIB29_06575 [Chloroflexi bacterium]|nr:hypothetical protein [Chloroflexota bacterium]